MFSLEYFFTCSVCTSNVCTVFFFRRDLLGDFSRRFFFMGFQFLHHSKLSFSMFFARICNLFVIFCKLLSCFKFQPTSGQMLKDFSKFRQIYGQLFIRELFLRVEYVDVDSRLRVRAITRTRQSTRNQQPKLGTVSPRPSALKRR